MGSQIYIQCKIEITKTKIVLDLEGEILKRNGQISGLPSLSP